MKHVLLDCDGVVTDLVRSTHFRMNRVYRSLELPTPSVSLLSDYEMKSIYPPPFHSLVPVIWRTTGFVSTMYLTNFGRTLLYATSPTVWPNKLPAPKFTFEFVTAPYRSATWELERENYLTSRYPHCKVNFAHDKSNFEGDVFVEDHPKNLVAWKLKHPQGEGILVKSRYMDSLIDDEFKALFGEGKSILSKLGIKIVSIPKLYAVLNS
jgi:hypothetical protein